MRSRLHGACLPHFRIKFLHFPARLGLIQRNQHRLGLEMLGAKLQHRPKLFPGFHFHLLFETPSGQLQPFIEVVFGQLFQLVPVNLLNRAEDVLDASSGEPHGPDRLSHYHGGLFFATSPLTIWPSVKSTILVVGLPAALQSRRPRASRPGLGPEPESSPDRERGCWETQADDTKRDEPEGIIDGTHKPNGPVLPPAEEMARGTIGEFGGNGGGTVAQTLEFVKVNHAARVPREGMRFAKPCLRRIHHGIS